MKKILLAGLSVVFFVSFYACNKTTDVSTTSQTENGLKASKTSGIKISEPVSFTLNRNTSANNTVTWQVLPIGGVYKAIQGSKATFKFGKSGKYFVITSNGLSKDTILVNVDSTVYTNSDTTTYQPIDSSFYSQGNNILVPIFSNDGITIKPSFFGTSNPSQDSFVLKLAGSSIQKYPSSSPVFNVSTYWDSTGLVYNYSGVYWDNSSSTITSPSVATGDTYFQGNSKYTIPFSIVYNNVRYTGSVKLVGNTATITWPYTSGVVISPLVINR